MKIVVASDSFKGSLSSEKIIEIVKKSAKKVFKDAHVDGVFTADGGEGTMDAVLSEMSGEKKYLTVKGPLFEDVLSCYALINKKTALIEMAKASGLTMVKEDKRNPYYTSSFGTGMLIKDALSLGIKDIIIGIGGSATNDGGIGAMTALGIKFLDKDKNILKGYGKDLKDICDIDLTNIDKRILDAHFTVMSDVKNPLLGENGATYTFGTQKGADSNILKNLEEGMKNYSDVVLKKTGKDFKDKEGAGAAGGLGYALMTFLNADLKSGIETVLDIVDFDEKIKDADLVITGEGRMDSQSAHGKVASGVGLRCRKYNVVCAAIVGSLLPGYESIYDCGINTVMTTVNGVMGLNEAIDNAQELYYDASCRLLNALKCGMEMKNR
ncbi:glycerate kinase [Clostridium sp. BJN0001]|uniref:glycerate kinase family protein n=1 Tax=Clostridium sp. BJN0001 TaxID=2930219 RepID=UPI001FD2C7FE|nr:glycerate kinase [Clostridium sp. BJN0001]